MQEEKHQTNAGKELLRVWESALEILSNIFSLAILEAKLAKRSLTIIAGFFLLIFLFSLSAWLFLMAIMVIWLSALGIGILNSLFIVFALNSLLIGGLFLFIKKYSRNLHFPATKKQFKHAASEGL